MGQVNSKKTTTFETPPAEMLGWGFDIDGNPVIINADGTSTIIPLITNAAIPNILANLGIDIEANLPAIGDVSVGDIYVTNDTFKKYTAVDAISWGSIDLINLQLVTDTSQSVKVLWQYDGAALQFISRGEILDLSTKENLSTGISYGGEITINGGDNTKFDIAAGQAIIVNSYTNPENPTFVTITWLEQLAVTVDNIATQLITFVSVENNGGSALFSQNPTSQDVEDNRDKIQLGVLVHENLTNISKASPLPNWNKDTDLKLLDLVGALQRINIDGGNKYYENGANLLINKTAGEVLAINGNYGTNKKSPNTITSAAEIGLTFFAAYIDGGTVISSETEIDTENYNPLGAGGLIPLPVGAVTIHGILFSPETGITVVHYGQYIYDTLKEAIDSWQAESYNIISELEGVSVMGVLAFVQGATDLSDPTMAKFIQTGAFGILGNVRTPEYSRYAGEEKILAGMTYKRPHITVLVDTGVIYADIERLGGGDLIFVFGEREYILNCTTGAGVGGKARISLTAGTFSTPQKNWVYAVPTTGNGHAQLQSSLVRPTGEFAYIHDCLLQDVTTFNTEKAQQSRRWTDAKEFDGRSCMVRSSERLRQLPADYESGIEQTVTIDTVPSPDTVNYTITAGEAWQKHLHDTPALSVFVDGIYIINHPTTPYTKITDLNDVEALQQSDGTSLSGLRFNWVFWMPVNMEPGECKLYLNLPIGAYATDEGAVADSNNTAVTSIPKDYKGSGMLLGRLPMRHRTQNGGEYTNLADQELGLEIIDLRGIFANVASGAIAVPATNSFEDVLFNIFNTASGFFAKFSASALAQSLTITFPNLTAGIMAITGMTEPFKFGGQATGGTKVVTFIAVASFNLNDGNSQEMVLSNNLTSLALTNKVTGGSYVIYLVQNATGGWTIPTPDSSWGNPTDNSSAFDTTADAVNLVNINVRPNGTTYYTVETYIP